MKPFLFLLHGWSGSSKIWDDLKYNLREKCRFSTPDLNYLFAKYGPEMFLDVLQSKIRQKRPVYLGGWSLGALLALQLAISDPSNIRGLILFNGTGCFCGEAGTGLPPRIVANMARNLQRNTRQTLSEFWETIFSPAEKAAGWQTKYLSRLRSADLNIDFLNYGLQYLKETNLLPELPHLHLPVLLFHGLEDKICPVEASYLLNHLLPNPRLVVYPSAGHSVFLTREADVIQSMEEFLNNR